MPRSMVQLVAATAFMSFIDCITWLCSFFDDEPDTTLEDPSPPLEVWEVLAASEECEALVQAIER